MASNRKPIRKTALAIAALLALGMAPSQQALAASCTWNPPTGNWNVAGNWSCGVVPSGGPDTATIAGGKVVTVNTTQSILNLNNSGGVNIDAFLLTLAGGGSTVNTGTINVGAGANPNNATLQVNAGHDINNTGGVINISADSVLNQFGSTITGGTINTSGSGKVVVFNNGANYMRGVTLNGNVDTATNTGLLRIANGFTLNGSASIDNGSFINLEGTQTIGGSGSFVFGATGNNRLGVDGGNITATLGANMVVRGHTGTVGNGTLVNGSGNTLLNLGTISADSGGTIAIDGATLANQNIVQATGAGSVLRLDSNVTNTGGTLRSTAGGVVLQNGVTVTGGSITNSGGAVYRATNNGGNFLSGVTLTAGSQIDLASALALERVTGGMTLNGTINVNTGSLINFEGDQTLAGSGSIVFGSTAANNRVGIDGGNKTLTVASGVTIRGENGIIGFGQLVNGSGNKLVNNGTISANVAGGTITLAGLDAGVTNNGTISALNGGTIALQSNLTGGGGSQLVAGAGSVISQQGVTISGVVNTSGSGNLRPTNNANNFLSGVTLGGSLDMASALSLERVVNNLVLNGTINVNNASIINFEGNQTLSGNGTIVFGATGASNRVGVDGGNKTLTVASTVTIRGQNGTIGLGQLVNGSGNALVNNGTISADVAGGVITLAGLDAGVTNNGTISALNGGTLQLQSNLIGSPGGQLVAGAGSVISQQGVTISGVINTSGGGNLRPTNSGTNFLSGVTLNGNLDMASAQSQERVINNLVLNGTINVNNASLLNFEGNQTLSGTGTIVFGATGASNRVGVDGGNKTLTLASGVTIRGQNGTIGLGQVVNGSGNSLVNQGLISSDSGGTINVGGATFVNQSFAEATGAGSVLRLDSDVTNTGGTLRSTAGGVVLQNAVTVTGGNISNSGGGTYRLVNSGSNFLSGVTLTSGSNIDMATAAATGRVINGMTVNGTVNIDNGSLLNMEGNQTLAGSGSIVFGATGNNRVGVDGGNRTLTIASGVTIRGVTGSIGLGQLINGSNNAIINNGTINSDGGGTITIQGLGGGLVSNGLLRAQSGSLNVSTALSGTGTLQVDATGVMNLANGAKTQGTLAMGAAGSTLNLGSGNLTITNDYTNAAAGTGNSFNRRAGVNGTGLVVAGANAAQAITGTGVTNGNTANASLTIGNVRVGDTTFNYQIANTGATGPSLRGAIQTTVNGASLTDARLTGAGVTPSNYNTGAPGNNTGNLGVTFTAAAAGVLAPLTGQVLNLRSNFENIPDQKLNIVLGAGAAAFNAAVGSTVTPVQVANQRTGGSNTAALTVANTAPAGAFSEDLNASIGGTTGAASASGSISGRLAGTNNTGTGAINVGVATGTAGAITGTVTLNYQTAGAVNGVSNGLGTASAGSQDITVNGNVYQIAQPSVPGSVNLGNVRVGNGANQAITIGNTNLAPGFQEGLNASVGTATNATGSGSITNLAAGATNTNIILGMTAASAGVNSGSVSLNLASNGAGTSGLSTLNLPGATVNTTITGFRLAEANTVAPVNFGNVLVGSTQTRNVTISNLAAADGFSEALSAAFGSLGGTNPAQFSTSGAVNLLGAGATNNSSMIVTLNTSAAGTFSANVQILLNSDGTGTSGLGVTALPTQVINLDGIVTGQVGNLAQAGAATPNPVNLGNVRVGAAAPSQALSITNTATGPAEGLNASISTATPGLTATGSFTSLAPQATNNTSLVVSMNTATAGSRNGTATITQASDGSFNNGTSTPLGTQTIDVTGGVFRLANPVVNTPSPINLAARVGGAGPSANISIINSSPDQFTEGLNVTRGSTPVGFTSSGSVSNLIAAGNSNAIQVTLNTTTAGTFIGNQALSFVSTGAGTTGAPDVGAGNANVGLNGKVYTAAQAQVNTATPINFGIVHVGDAVPQAAVSVTNSAPVTALNDTLRMAFASATGTFAGSGNLGAVGIAAGSTDATSLKVAMSTLTAGIFSGSASFSAASHNADLADLDLGNVTVSLAGQVNNFARSAFGFASGAGTFGQNGSVFTLDFGTRSQGSGILNANLFARNAALGPADLLEGSFRFLDVLDFGEKGFDPFAGLEAGEGSDLLQLAFNTANLGTFSDSIVLHGFGSNAGGFRGEVDDITLLVRGTVIAGSGNGVPEPTTPMLLLLAMAMLWVARVRVVRRRSAY